MMPSGNGVFETADSKCGEHIPPPAGLLPRQSLLQEGNVKSRPAACLPFKANKRWFSWSAWLHRRRPNSTVAPSLRKTENPSPPPVVSLALTSGAHVEMGTPGVSCGLKEKVQLCGSSPPRWDSTPGCPGWQPGCPLTTAASTAPPLSHPKHTSHWQALSTLPGPSGLPCFPSISTATSFRPQAPHGTTAVLLTRLPASTAHRYGETS